MSESNDVMIDRGGVCVLRTVDSGEFGATDLVDLEGRWSGRSVLVT